MKELLTVNHELNKPFRKWKEKIFKTRSTLWFDENLAGRAGGGWLAGRRRKPSRSRPASPGRMWKSSCMIILYLNHWKRFQVKWKICKKIEKQEKKAKKWIKELRLRRSSEVRPESFEIWIGGQKKSDGNMCQDDVSVVGPLNSRRLAGKLGFEWLWGNWEAIREAHRQLAARKFHSKSGQLWPRFVSKLPHF